MARSYAFAKHCNILRGHVIIVRYYFQLRDYHTPKQIYAAMNAVKCVSLAHVSSTS